MTVPLRAFGTLRVSTDDQADTHLGLDAQRTAIEDAARRRHWDLVDVVIDVASGGALRKRPQLAMVLDRLDAGDGNVLIAARLDRLTRSLADFITILTRAEKHGWQVVVLDIDVDTTTPSGELLAHIVASTAQYERRLISARTKEAMAELKRQGRPLGRPRAVPEAIRQQILASRNAGHSYRAIAEALNNANVPTAHGGQRWWPATIRAIS